MTEFVKDKDCLVCGPGVLIELDSSISLQKVGYLAYANISLISDVEKSCKSFMTLLPLFA